MALTVPTSAHVSVTSMNYTMLNSSVISSHNTPGIMPGATPEISNLETKSTDFLRELAHTVSRGNGTPRDLNYLSEFFQHMKREVNPKEYEIFKSALYKKQGYFFRLFSKENWNEWIENRTALGKVVTVFRDCMSDTKRLSQQTIIDANNQAGVVLNKLAIVAPNHAPAAFEDQVSSRNGLASNILEDYMKRNSPQVVGNVYFSSLVTGASALLTRLNDATTFPVAAAEPATNVISEYIKKAGMLGNINQIKDAAVRIIEDKSTVQISNSPVYIAIDYFIGVLTTIGDATNFYAALIQGGLERIAVEKIQMIEEVVKQKNLPYLYEYSLRRIKEIKLWIPKAKEALEIAIAELERAKENYNNCKDLLVKAEQDYADLVSHANDPIKLSKLNSFWANRLNLASEVKARMDAVVDRPITDEMLNNGPAHIREAYYDAINMIAEAKQNMQDLTNAMKDMINKQPLFTKALDQSKDFISKIEASCTRAKNSHQRLEDAAMELNAQAQEQLDNLKTYQAFVALYNKDEL